jgi:ubiquinol-cytochrome c reductase cytochrome b subunit
MLATGTFLAMQLTPTSNAGAFLSVEAIDRQLAGGWLLRAMHMTGANLFLAALYVHLFRGLYYGSYKAPRETAVAERAGAAGYGHGHGLCRLHAAVGPDVLLGGGRDYQQGRGRRAGHWSQRWSIFWPGATIWAMFSCTASSCMHFLLAFLVVGRCGAARDHCRARCNGSNNPVGIEPQAPRATPCRSHPYYHQQGSGWVWLLFALVFAAADVLLAQSADGGGQLHPRRPHAHSGGY